MRFPETYQMMLLKNRSWLRSVWLGVVVTQVTLPLRLIRNGVKPIMIGGIPIFAGLLGIVITLAASVWFFFAGLLGYVSSFDDILNEAHQDEKSQELHHAIMHEISKGGEQ